MNQFFAVSRKIDGRGSLVRPSHGLLSSPSWNVQQDGETSSIMHLWREQLENPRLSALIGPDGDMYSNTGIGTVAMKALLVD
jgi:hypothetical protein